MKEDGQLENLRPVNPVDAKKRMHRRCMGMGLNEEGGTCQTCLTFFSLFVNIHSDMVVSG